MGDKIFERLGVYDVLGVLLPGICMTGATKLIFDGFSLQQWVAFIQFDSWTFLVVSYIVGLVFQEVTHVLQLLFVGRSNKLLVSALNPKSNSHLRMEQSEIKAIEKKIKENAVVESEKIEWNVAYNYCRSYVAKNGNTARLDRDQALAAMARSFSLYCLTMFITLLISLVTSNTQYSLPFLFILIALPILSGVFAYRFVRFSHRRYIATFRCFLYNGVSEKKGE